MKTLKFARNYNHKLDNPIFTTIRDATDCIPDLYEEEVMIEPEDAPAFYAKLVDVKFYDSLEDVPRHTLYQDTGLDNFDDCRILFSEFGIILRDPVAVLTFKRKDTDQ